MSLVFYFKCFLKKYGIDELFKKEQKKRHHRSKHFKPLTDDEDKLISCGWDKMNPDNKFQMLAVAKYWFNSADDFDTWKDTIESYKADRDSEAFKSRFFWKMVDEGQVVPQRDGVEKEIGKGITRKNFSKMFDICFIEHIDKWIKEIELDNKNRVSGELENMILDTFEGRTKIKLQEIYKKLEFEAFESNIKATITKMLNKNVLKALPLTKYKEQYYEMLAKTDSKGFYLP